MTEAAEEIRAAADPEANIIFGTSFDERMGDEVTITVIATGFDPNRKPYVAKQESGQVQRVAAGARSGRFEASEMLADLERQRTGQAEGVGLKTRVQSYGPLGQPERQPVPVPVQQPLVHRPIPDGSGRRTYDEADLEIPSFLRRTQPEDGD